MSAEDRCACPVCQRCRRVGSHGPPFDPCLCGPRTEVVERLLTFLLHAAAVAGWRGELVDTARDYMLLRVTG